MLAPNIYDTEKGILQKDMVDPDGQPTMQAPLTVPDETRAKIYAITGDDTAGSYPKDERAVAFCAFTGYMETVFRDSDAYQSLPEAVSAYA